MPFLPRWKVVSSEPSMETNPSFVGLCQSSSLMDETSNWYENRRLFCVCVSPRQSWSLQNAVLSLNHRVSPPSFAKYNMAFPRELGHFPKWQKHRHCPSSWRPGGWGQWHAQCRADSGEQTKPWSLLDRTKQIFLPCIFAAFNQLYPRLEGSFSSEIPWENLFVQQMTQPWKQNMRALRCRPHQSSLMSACDMWLTEGALLWERRVTWALQSQWQDAGPYSRAALLEHPTRNTQRRPKSGSRQCLILLSERWHTTWHHRKGSPGEQKTRQRDAKRRPHLFSMSRLSF